MHKKTPLLGVFFVNAWRTVEIYGPYASLASYVLFYVDHELGGRA